VIERSERRRDSWYRNYIDASLTRDLSTISDLTRIDEIPRLLRLLAANAANVLKYRTVAEGLDITQETVKTYTGLLEQLGLVVRLPGWRPGFAARETSKPKSYITDTGMLCYLMGANEERLKNDDQVTGRSVENFVVMEILRHIDWSSQQVRAFHYHQADRDVDLILERNDGSIAAIEVKSAASVRTRDYRWLEFLRDKAGKRFVSGVVICTTDQRVPLGDRLWASPISALWK
jgi:predicted AAA+ superfamily ATPase